MAALKQIIRGDSHDIDVTFLHADGLTPIDLTGATVFFTAHRNAQPQSDTDAAIRTATTQHTDAANGKTRISLDATDTSVEPGTYYYDIQLVQANGTVISRPARPLVVKADITRRTTV